MLVVCAGVSLYCMVIDIPRNTLAPGDTALLQGGNAEEHRSCTREGASYG